MLTVKSKADRTKVYLFESRDQPVTAGELARENSTGVSGKLEDTLSLERSHPPFDDGDYAKWKGIMKDCADFALKTSLDNSYDSMVSYLSSIIGRNGEIYRIHSVRVQG